MFYSVGSESGSHLWDDGGRIIALFHADCR